MFAALTRTSVELGRALKLLQDPIHVSIALAGTQASGAYTGTVTASFSATQGNTNISSLEYRLGVIDSAHSTITWGAWTGITANSKVAVTTPAAYALEARATSRMETTGSDAKLFVVQQAVQVQLQGVVIDSLSGAPVANVGVSAFSWVDNTAGQSVGTQTGADGRYTLRLPDGITTYQLFANYFDAGNPSLNSQFLNYTVEVSDAEADLTLILPSARITAFQQVGSSCSVNVAGSGFVPNHVVTLWMLDNSRNPQFSYKVGITGASASGAVTQPFAFPCPPAGQYSWTLQQYGIPGLGIPMANAANVNVLAIDGVAVFREPLVGVQ